MAGWVARTPPLITTFCFQGLAACGDGEDIRVGKVARVLEEVVRRRRRRRRQERKRRLVFCARNKQSRCSTKSLDC